MRATITTLCVCGLSIGIGLGACVTVEGNPEHCLRQDGDATCRERYGDSRRFCSEGSCRADAVPDGCVAERPTQDACYSPCGGGKTLAEDPSCDGTAEGGTSAGTSVGTSQASTSGSTEPTAGSFSGSATDTSASETTSPAECMDSGDCTDPLLPVCEGMLCVACGDAATPDAACEEKDAATPTCRDDGACVQCTPTNAAACDGNTPVCDAGTSACVACSYHEQCATTACDIETGACFEDTCVVEVDDQVGGSIDYDNIGAAIADGCVVIVHELDGQAFYADFAVAGDKVAVLAADGELPQVQGLAGNPSLALDANATVYIQGLKFSGNTGAEGIVANDSILYLDRVQVVQNAGGGLVLEASSHGHVRNAAIGGSATADVAATMVDASTLDALYTTMVGYDDGGGGGAALRCESPVDVLVRNSLLAKTFTTPELECGEADISYSATESPRAGIGNVALGDMTPSWFDAELHLNMTPGAVLTTASWQLGDPPTDIDGDARPATDGAADVAGADVP